MLAQSLPVVLLLFQLAGTPNLCERGEALFRQARFDEAAAVWSAALERDPKCARAHWGLGRIAKLQFRRATARDHFSAAYQLDWRDPEIVIDYAYFVSDPAARRTLLRNAIAFAGSRSATLARDALAQLEIDRNVEHLRLNSVASAYREYALKLEPYFPVSAEAGMLLTARLNGGKPLRLVLDTGAEGISVNAKAGRENRLELLTRSLIAGLGGDDLRNGEITLAKTVAFGELQFENRLVQISERRLVPGADGVIGTDVFQEFFVRIDPRAHALTLTPFPARAKAVAGVADPWILYESPPGQAAEGATAMVRLCHLLMIKATLNGARAGHFLLDSGSAFNAISDRLATMVFDNGVAVRGVQGELGRVPSARAIRLEWGSERVEDARPLSLDLGRIEDLAGAEISGIIGLPALKRFVVTLNYRDGLVSFVRRDGSRGAYAN